MPRPSAALPIDGSYGEGGGALVRTALAMATLTQQPVRITNVRGATKFPGLHSEDLTVLRALALSCHAETQGAELRSHDLTFTPRKRPRGLTELVSVVDDAGGGNANACVVAAALMPVLARSGMYSTLVVQGETYGHATLTYDYLAQGTLAAFRSFGLYAYPEMMKAGFGRMGQGEIKVDIEPSATQGVDLSQRGELLGVRAVVTTAELSSQVAERGVAHLERLGHAAGLRVEVETHAAISRDPGAFVTVVGEFERGFGGGTAMGARGVRVEAVAQQAFDAYLEWHRTDATLDVFMADQVLMIAALAEGDTVFRVPRLTARLITTAWVIRQFLPIRLTIRGQEGEPGQVTIRRGP